MILKSSQLHFRETEKSCEPVIIEVKKNAVKTFNWKLQWNPRFNWTRDKKFIRNCTKTKKKKRMNKLKAVARSVSFSTKSSNAAKNNRHEKDKIEPVVGFHVTLYDAANVATDGETQLVSPFRWSIIQKLFSSTAWSAFNRRQTLALKFRAQNSRRLHCQGWKSDNKVYLFSDRLAD